MEELTRFNHRTNFVYDPVVKGADTDFWSMDSAAGLTADTVRGALKLGDTGAAHVSASSFAQFLYGDFEFSMLLDSTTPKVGDTERYFGLRNPADTAQRGAAYFDLRNDSTAGDSSPAARPFAVVAFDEQGNRQRKHVTWDTDWSGNGVTRFRIRWESDGYTFLVNDSVIGILGDRDSNGVATNQVNTSIPQHIRISDRSADTADTSPPALKLLAIRSAHTISGRLD